MKRIFRFVVSFLLICVILVNCSPIRAKAVEPVTLVLVSAATVIASVMIGIGVMMGQNREAFDQVVQMVQGSNALKDFIQQDATKGEVIPLYRSPGNGGVGSGVLSLLVSGGLIEAIRQVLFEEQVVTGSSLPEGYAYYGDYLIPVIDSIWDKEKYPYACIARFGEDYYSVMFSQMPQHIESSGKIRFSGSGYVQSSIKYSGSNSWDYNSRSFYRTSSDSSGAYADYIWSNYDIPYDSDGSLFIAASDPVYSNISVSEGLVAGEIASQEQELSEGYSDWTANSEWDVNNSQWWPVAVAPTYDETVTFTQEQVQNGEGTYIIADDPVYNVNLPVSGSVTYERFASAQPLTVSATVTDGGTISYVWFRYQMEPTLGGSETVGEGPSIVPETVNTGTWVYYCKATNTISGVSSLPVTSNYCNVTVIDPNDEENPDISPTEAPGVDPDPGGDSDLGGDSGPNSIDSYAIDLTGFFPFCIPFDLYDFLSLLSAEPEAPHLEFDIDFPYMDEPWHLVIDLSPWDSVAQLLRRLELLLFIVGLGMVTREKFLRG